MYTDATLNFTGLSYCRHRSNLQKNISHMLLTNPSYQLEEDSSTLTDDTLQLLTDADGRVKFIFCIKYNYIRMYFFCR